MNKQTESLKMAKEAWDKIDISNQSNEECARSWFIEGYVQALEQPAQEPVAWMDEFGHVFENESDIDDSGSKIPLYTHPAPSWQGLSDDEMDEIIKKHDGIFGSVVRAIEQALKDRNT